ncbi:MAG TPA: PQQ-binding-like beta-propeller repeat protein, partial [Blastocatellia bacterium]|nr:PQQ-binding-like beta-propeller repeat protein [Blastocatellia bacterium]
MRLKSCLIVCALALQMVAVASAQQSRNVKSVAGNGGARPSDWPMYGRDLAGSHYNPTEKLLTPATVSRLKPKWVFETHADVSSQPTVVNGVVYFGSWDGYQYAVDAKTGQKLWAFEVGEASRSGAAYADGVIYFGDIKGRLYALDAKTGALKWKTRIDD